MKGEQKSNVHICFSEKILCSNETAGEAQCVSEEVENCFSLNRKHICHLLEILVFFKKSLMGIKEQILTPGSEFAPRL